MTDPQLSPQDHEDPEKKKILNLYAAFGISLILSLMPSAVAALVSLIFMLGVLIAAYVIRAKVENHDLAGNHCTYIIRTIWIGSLFSLITIGITSLFMLPQIDYTTFQPCAENLASQSAEFLAGATHAQIMELSQPCMDAFIESNWNTFLMAGIFGVGPILVYFAVRFTRGLLRAVKGYRVADPMTWF